MNNFEQTFFKKYVAEGQEIIEIFHRHAIRVIDDIILGFGLGVLIPAFLYYNSLYLQKMINFTYFEIYLILVYIVIIYKILEWSLLKSSSQFASYEHIEGVGVEKSGFLDTILQKGDLIIHKFLEEEIVLDEASKPYKIVDKIESITNEIEHEPENDKFDLMMDALGGMVQSYLGDTGKKKEDIFKSPHSVSPKAKEVEQKLSSELQQEFLEKIEKTNGTIDLR